jgi:hypothetical protein
MRRTGLRGLWTEVHDGAVAVGIVIFFSPFISVPRAPANPSNPFENLPLHPTLGDFYNTNHTSFPTTE